MPYWSPSVSRSFPRCVRAVSRTGNSQIRRSSNRTTKRGQVRPTTATFSFYANFVNTLFSRLSYFSRHAISHHRTVPCPIDCRTGRWTENEIFPAKGDNRETVYCSYCLLRKNISKHFRKFNEFDYDYEDARVRELAYIYYSSIKKKFFVRIQWRNNLYRYFIR